MNFYTFEQNNSFGIDIQNSGIGWIVVIEAESSDAANERAESIGIYFNGVAEGRDCECCGDRWSRAWEGENPHFKFEAGMWVHFADGQVKKTDDTDAIIYNKFFGFPRDKGLTI